MKNEKKQEKFRLERKFLKRLQDLLKLASFKGKSCTVDGVKLDIAVHFHNDSYSQPKDKMKQKQQKLLTSAIKIF